MLRCCLLYKFDQTDLETHKIVAGERNANDVVQPVQLAREKHIRNKKSRYSRVYQLGISAIHCFLKLKQSNIVV